MKVEIIKIEGKNIEYVIEGGQNVESAELADWVKTGYVRLGSAEISMTEGKVSFCSMNQSDQKAEVKSPTNPIPNAVIKKIANRNNLKIDERFIVNIQGNEFITYNGLLEYAKNQHGGIQKREIIEIITSEDRKSASARVRITMKEGQIFEDVGTCTPENAKSVKSYPEELAVTRAYSRALRFGLVVDYCSQEELS